MELGDHQEKEKARMSSSSGPAYSALLPNDKEPPSSRHSSSATLIPSSNSSARGEGDPNGNESFILTTTFTQALVQNDLHQDQFHHHLPQPPSQRRYQDPDPNPTLNHHLVAAETIGAAAARYRECLKNHAASIGGHVTDGCGEFMPGGEEGTPEALKCAACDCHRNFHRKEVGEPPYHNTNYHYPHSHSNPNRNNTRNGITRRNDAMPPPPRAPHHHQIQPYPTPPPPSLHQLYHHHARPSQSTMMAFGGGGGPAESSSEDLNVYLEVHQHSLHHAHPTSKKRFRTKFTAVQKDKMMEFAENLGWKIQKQDEQQVKQFCTELGIKRQVFKVWMHNNKQAMKKKQS